MAQNNTVNSLMVSFEKAYAKLPPLPTGVKDFLVMVAPWFALIFGVIGVLGSLSAFGLSTVLSPLVALGGGVGVATSLMVVSLIGLVQSVMMLVAFPSLMKRKTFGWSLLFWSEVLAVISSVISFSVVGVVLTLVWFYFIFQVKSYYK